MMARKSKRLTFPLTAAGAFLAFAAIASAAPGDLPGGSAGRPSSSTPPVTNTDDYECSAAQELECESNGGIAASRGIGCFCDYYEHVPLRIVNAGRGDVGIVPIDGRGSEQVATVTRAIGQFHRHAVMFFRNGTMTRHNTMYLKSEEDGDRAGRDYTDFFRPDTLTNGLPGAITQTAHEAFERERLAFTGLLLKPALEGTEEPMRPRFAAAVASARGTPAFYKLSDYTAQVSMMLPDLPGPVDLGSDRSGDQKGSHCAGYIAAMFRGQAFFLPNVTYPESVRLTAARALFSGIQHNCENQVGAFVLLNPHLCTSIANQVTNCFAGLGCGRPFARWRNRTGTGFATSPDNLLPRTFRYSGGEYEWDHRTIPEGDRVMSHPDLAVPTSPNTASPFQRVEPQIRTRSYMRLVDSELMVASQ